MSAAPNILCFNTGSSSLKFGLYETTGFTPLFAGEIDGIGADLASIRATDDTGRALVDEEGAVPSAGDAAALIFSLLKRVAPQRIDAIAHRIVHGGPRVRDHRIVDAATLKDLDAAAGFAPLHMQPALEILRYAQRDAPRVPNIACLDTAFHSAKPEVARRIPLPEQLLAGGIERYGFHGLSCDSILRRLGPALPARLIVAHLGNGASITAIRDGKSLDNSMGLTPLGGTIMGTRPGDLDPGVILYLLKQGDRSLSELDALLNHASGLSGVSGGKSDMRALEHDMDLSRPAGLAVEMFCYSVRKHIAAMAAVLEGLDLLVFTGGIGENDARIRARICDGLKWIGAFTVRAMPAQEEEQMARLATRLLVAPRAEETSSGL